MVVLLDDQLAPPDMARSRLYSRLRQRLVIDSPQTLGAALTAMQHGLEQDWFVVMLLDYELGEALQGLPDRDAPPTPSSQILLFEHCEHLQAAQVDQWLDEQALAHSGATPTLTGWQPNITPQRFEASVARIRQHIEAGDTYQVNLCFGITARLTGEPLGLYRELRKHQAVGYGALIGLPDGQWILSRSPELFVSSKGGWLQARPMKGTAPAQSNFDLANDPKNTAENVMIVDLLRNDLGRLAVPGSVSVPERFDVKRYGDVLQMTSTVRARLRPDVDWHELIAAVFPCGSITGAPKQQTMRIIREIEPGPRGLYTGAIGWIDPAPRGSGSKACGVSVHDFCFSVPIRTLTVAPPTSSGERGVKLGIGAGITYSSQAADEWAECQLKASFLKRLVKPLGLFETMRATPPTGVAYLERHLDRLQGSAKALGLAFERDAARDAVMTACQTLDPDIEHRVKLELNPDGQLRVTSGQLTPIACPVDVLLAPERMTSTNGLLRHKTSDRAHYDAAWQQAEKQGAFDMLFFNERDELTEGGRSNVFVKLDGRWYTPPVQAGVLPGIMRAVLLQDSKLDANVRTITRDELLAAQDLMVCNALRGAMPARLVPKQQQSLNA